MDIIRYLYKSIISIKCQLPDDHYCSITAPLLHHYCSITSKTITASLLHHCQIITASLLHHHCIIPTCVISLLHGRFGDLLLLHYYYYYIGSLLLSSLLLITTVIIVGMILLVPELLTLELERQQLGLYIKICAVVRWP
jgi:hypothetical protein